jgi:hypothetical protein
MLSEGSRLEDVVAGVIDWAETSYQNEGEIQVGGLRGEDNTWSDACSTMLWTKSKPPPQPAMRTVLILGSQRR